MTFTQKLFSFQGRLRRRDYWLLSLLLVAIAMVAYAVAAVMGVEVTGESAEATILQLGVSAVLIWPSLAVGVKRCHDRNQSGWWLLIEFVPLVGGVWALINLGILDGTQGVNRFGKSPKGIGGETDGALADVFA
ncbi:DUF805 domain-containing protein [Caulobacter sp. UNC358MFTsu5.1]|uniref:DUF805 domain-containing protein n=1 Tax=Caulobacter sp. UNC358MFTsu5.1 TaxID=1449049 RepID=UPI0004A6D19A|nr:DUF805 domain-containing protein [Caulobacter sp. UNC358MFTsu5.1]